MGEVELRSKLDLLTERFEYLAGIANNFTARQIWRAAGDELRALLAEEPVRECVCEGGGFIAMACVCEKGQSIVASISAAMAEGGQGVSLAELRRK